jgi:hypothetical protein
MAKRKKGSTKSAREAAVQEYRKPEADIFTLLLVIALLMVIIAIVSLRMTMQEYKFEIKGGPNPTWHLPARGATLDPQNGVV